jgi:hypothetical protein
MVRACDRLVLGLAASAVISCATMSVAGASEPTRRTSTLAWVRLPGAESCIGTLELAQAVEARLGRLVFAPVSRADIAVEGRIEPIGRGFSAFLSVTNRARTLLGSRRIESKDPDCRSIDRALVLVTSLLIDPEASFVEPAKVPSQSDSRTSSVSSNPEDVQNLKPEVPPAPESPPVADDGWRLFASLGLAGSVGAGPLPGINPGASASFVFGMQDGLRGRAAFSFGYGGANTQGGASVDMVLAAGAAALCYARSTEVIESVGLCAGTEVGSVFAATSGLEGAQDRGALWLATAIGLHADWRLTDRWLLEFALELLVPLRRDRFTYEDVAGTSRVLFEQSPVGGRLSLGVGLSL